MSEQQEETKQVENAETTQTNEENKSNSVETATQAQEGASSSATEQESNSTFKTEQSNAENAKYAEMRRKYEALERENQALKSKQRGSISDDTLNALGITKEELEEDSSIELTSLYLEGLSKKVDNPVQYAYQQLYKKNLETSKQAKIDKQKAEDAKKAEFEKIEQDKALFKQTFPDEDISKIIKPDSEFRKSSYVQEFIKNFGEDALLGDITKHFAIYKATRGNTKVASNVAKSATPYTRGAPSGTNGTQTNADIMKMSNSEYQAWRREQIHKH